MGRVSLPNIGDGIRIDGTCRSTTIGGTAVGAGNVISGNMGDGIALDGSSGLPVWQILIQGNFIGTDGNANRAVANGGNGLQIDRTLTITIGGTAAGAGNVISGNQKAGIAILDSASGIMVQGNWIGTDLSGSFNLGNDAAGIDIESGASNNTIGRALGDHSVPPLTGPDPTGNFIAFNTIGIVVKGDDTLGNVIRGNSIYSNTPPLTDGYTYDPGIDLGGDGRTANQSPQDSIETGPNGWQNFPISSLVKPNGSALTEIIGTMMSLPNTEFTLDFYTNPTNGLGDIRQGKFYLGNFVVTTDSTGFAGFDVTFNTTSRAISATATGPSGTSEMEFMYTRPVLFMPGIAGSFPDPTSSDFNSWLLHRGFDPTELHLDPLAHSYDDLIQTLENMGYVLGQTLFAANYDWRVSVAPLNASGSLVFLTAGVIVSDIAHQQYASGVDYLVYWIEQAALAFEGQNPGVPLDSVDVIAHSTGGIVTRAYIQGGAYGGTANLPGLTATTKLPEVNNFVMLGVPNLGSPRAFNILNNNWFNDPAYVAIFSTIVAMAYRKLLNGQVISGPNGSNIKLRDIQNPDGTLNYQQFIRLYIPTVYDLMTIQQFLDLGTGTLPSVNSNPVFRNNLLLQLDTPAGLQSFVSRVHHLTDIYGYNVSTTVTDTGQIGPILFGGLIPEPTIWPFDGKLPRVPGPGELWYQEKKSLQGDGTVPLSSSDGPFVGDLHVTLIGLNGVEHFGLPWNPLSQTSVLGALGFNTTQRLSISTDKHNSDYISVYNARYIIIGVVQSAPS